MVFFLLATTKVEAGFVLLDLADGFDFPVGKPDAKNYYRARGYWPGGHHGEDWNGVRGGNTDLGDPIYSMGDGIVVQARDIRLGWGNVVIIRHAYRDPKTGKVRTIDSLYGHLHRMNVRKYQRVKRGQLIGTMGTNRGMYYAHLHFEIRKNLNIGMDRSKFRNDYSNYYSPHVFIKAHRNLKPEARRHRVPVDTFIHNGSTLLASKSGVKKKEIVTLPNRSKKRDPKSLLGKIPKLVGNEDKSQAIKDTAQKLLNETAGKVDIKKKKTSLAKFGLDSKEDGELWAKLKKRLKK